MPQRYTGQWPVALAGLIVMLMGSWTMYMEAMPNFRGGPTAIARLQAMNSGEEPIGLSILSQQRALLDCEELFRSSRALEMQYLSQEERSRLGGICGRMADEVISHAPADGFAWLIRAAAKLAQQDVPAFNNALQLSRLVAPNEGWLANMRIRVADAGISNLTEDSLAGYEGDIRVVASTYIYAPLLARRYLSDSEFRDRMNGVLEELSPPDQRRFLSIIRSTLTVTGR